MTHLKISVMYAKFMLTDLKQQDRCGTVELGTIHILRKHILGLFSTHPPTHLVSKHKIMLKTPYILRKIF